MPSTTWHARTVEETLAALAVQPDLGLSDVEAEQRRREHGPNQLEETKIRPWWEVLFRQLRSVVVVLLGAAAILAFATQRFAEGGAVLAVIVINTTIGFVSEWKAVRSMAALRKLGEHSTTVRRDGQERQIGAPDLVPGDIVVLEAGALVPADLRVLEGQQLRVNESPLTGESVPADKTTEPIDEQVPLADRLNMLYKGTSVVDGRAVGVVVATGTQTELGRISELTAQAEAAVAPLQTRLNALGRRLAWLTIGIALIVAAIGFFVRRSEATLVIETALALGIAAIPEGLPIVATIALARGMVLMARRNALVNRLAAVETLGATGVIFTDKTGTLTENRMRLRKIVTAAGEHSFEGEGEGEGGNELDPVARRVLEIGILCNTALIEETASEDNPRGDPTELALLVGGRERGIEREHLLADKPELRVDRFEPRVKKMATFHKAGARASEGPIYVAVKGAPGAVLEVSNRIANETSDRGDGCEALTDELRELWSTRAKQLASEGLRLLAMADKHVDSDRADPYRDLCLVGFAGMFDPPRVHVKAAIDKCQAAGIRVEMVTGDQPETALAIAHAVGIIGGDADPEPVVMLGHELQDPETLDDAELEHIYRANIYARVSPEQKLNLIQIYQDRGEVVAMTGDGVNDAPALKKADIGVAMGARGTEAAKQVADMVLRDDSFETIVAAVEHGRVIFGNIRKSVIFMLCTNVAEILAVTLATLVGWTLPLLPLQILYLNVLTDVFPALALGVGPGSGAEMRHPPRDPQESVLTGHHWIEIVALASVIGMCVLAAMLLAQRRLGFGDLAAVTVSFLTLGFGKLWFTFCLRDPDTRLFDNEITRNPWVWGALGLCVALLLAATYLPGLTDLLGTEAPTGRGWALVMGMSVVPLVVGQIIRGVQGRRR